MGRHRLRKLLTKAVLNDDKNLSEEEQEDVIGIVTRNMRSISESRPERLVRLQNDLELANLEGFIDRFRGMLEEGHGEAVWQEFFDANPFILSLTFGCPIIKVGPQASVGGRKLFGGGEKVTDFLMKNKMTNNAAVVEIKTPGAKLVKREFRSGVFFPVRKPVGVDGAGTRSEVSVSAGHFRDKGQKQNSRYRNLCGSMLPCNRNDAER